MDRLELAAKVASVIQMYYGKTYAPDAVAQALAFQILDLLDDWCDTSKELRGE